MKSFDIGQMISILANIGVIAGIAFLAFEIHQNNELLEAQARFNHKETRANLLGEFESNPELARITVKAKKGEGVTAEEQLQLNAYNDKRFVSWEWEYYEARAGRIEIPVAGYRSDMSDPVVRRRWDVRKLTLSPDFVRYIEENIIDR
ncbi:MAG: hypothetical protein PVF50_11405 [Gammaproteobacteria bacterium]